MPQSKSAQQQSLHARQFTKPLEYKLVATGKIIADAVFRPTTRRKNSPNLLIQQTYPHSAKKAFRRGPWIIGGLAIYSFTAYGFYLYCGYNRAAEAAQESNVPLDVSDRYNKTAKGFDNEVDFTEKLMGLGWLRSSLAKRAHGNVLEVSVGTGRNMKYLDLAKCKSITMIDQSGEMVEIARKKFKELHPKHSDILFRTQSAASFISCPSADGFDVIFQTMGLCSTPAPEKLLQNLGRIVNQKHGQILLLEHGRSHYTWLNRILDNLAPTHADKHGCWWNKDIGAIVSESGLEIIKIKRYHLGTTWWVELRPIMPAQTRTKLEDEMDL
ncbi:MAG: hypothetical protein M1827_002771 [Pycnora praestabilis]|nr:MAG: hypothetical protein M1827_002771 [Pycnora praestabilis]